MSYAAGVDVWSTQKKAVIIDESRHIVGRVLIDTGSNVVMAAENAYQSVVQDARLMEVEVEYIIGTGYGRYQVTFGNTQVTEISCHGMGAVHMFPGTRTVVDMGGQDTKAIRVSKNGDIIDFCMNDKCAAGSGAFLEKTARYVGYATEEIGPLVTMSREKVPISGVCAVFAESEVINHLSRGCPPSDIMYGAISSLVDRSIQLMKRVRMEPEFTFVGGSLRFVTMADVIRGKLGVEVNVPENDMPQFTAAILGHYRLNQLQEK